jgi:hypothetical protein
MVAVVVVVLDAVADATIGRGEPGLSKVSLPPHVIPMPPHMSHKAAKRHERVNHVSMPRAHGNGVGKQTSLQLLSCGMTGRAQGAQARPYP